ncbi:DUF4118 domain-containing protein [Dactylosporangium salmoneum]|uniref:histidine kinase n=1 Tax=Dactylosporangium salmoneum TaxID=53361 RepID=A0ABP5T3E3_9ACTN
MRARLTTLLLRPKPPPLALGFLVAAMLIGVETAVMLPFRDVHEGVRSVVYLCGVLVVATVWGAKLAVVTSVASAAAFSFFYAPAYREFSHSAPQDLQIVLLFIAAGLLASFLADLSRFHAAEASQRRQEADLVAELARQMLHAGDLHSVLGPAAQRIAEVFGLPFATIELGAVAGDERRAAVPLWDGATRLGTLLVPAELPARTFERLRQRVVPSLEALLSATAGRTNSLQASREQASRLMSEQAALRRVATLVAHGAAPTAVFDAVTAELCRICGPQNTGLVCYEPDGTGTLVSGRNEPGIAETPAGTCIPLQGDCLSGIVKRTGRSARTTYDPAVGPTAKMLRDLGIRSGIGVPVIVEGRLWGAAVVTTTSTTPISDATEARLVEFTELLATAIANAHSHTQLTASRARIVTAADNTRRQLERDLHDGTQQRLLSLALQLRTVEASIPPGQDTVKEELSSAVSGLIGVCEDLRELSRGIHPAILSKGGLGPALKTLARRSTLPVNLTVDIDRRLPERVEVTAYYIVSEALTNAAKHARATLVCVDAEADDTTLGLTIRDNGVGGASTGKGSGLIGLQDRTEALRGKMEITSPPGAGTTLLFSVPLKSS